MTKAFISFHHSNDQEYKDHLSWLADEFDCFENTSVGVGDIEDDGRSSEKIRQLIRDYYLRDTEVVILLCGKETRDRKYVDWELKSAMINTQLNRKSGILVINLPGVAASTTWTAALPDEKKMIYPDYTVGYVNYDKKSQYEQQYPLMPPRIVDNLLNPKVQMSVVPWERIEKEPHKLKWLVDKTSSVAKTNEYDLRRPMRRRNHSRYSSFDLTA